MFFPSTYGFYPVWNAGRVVVTIHDALTRRHPELVFPTRRGRFFWDCKENLALWRADRLVTVTETARRDVETHYRVPDRLRPIAIIPEGPSPAFRKLPVSDGVLRRHGIDPARRFVLYVGGLSPHKNLLRLTRAFAEAVRDQDDVDLMLVGDHADVFHTHLPEIRSAIVSAGVAGRVLLPGYVPDDDLVHLYNRAVVLAQPSLWEGFGLPPVEAMACGTPVAASTAGSLPEVVGEAGSFFEPTDEPAMSKVLQRFLADPAFREDLAERALARAKRFTHLAASEALLACFEATVAPRTARRPA
jgi:glycosyltransferase involved in cell wall biosynthesis